MLQVRIGHYNPSPMLEFHLIFIFDFPFVFEGSVSVVELKQSSVVQRFLTGWMPTAIR